MNSGQGKKLLGGVIPVLSTPFTPDGAVDRESFRALIEAAIAGGANGLAMFGLASEYYKLSEDERSGLVQVLVQQTAKRCPVVISITAHSTVLAKKEAAQAAEYGADVLMIMPPFFLGPSMHAVVQHIREVAAVVRLPMILQYAPLQTGRFIEAAVFAELSRSVPNLTHVKVDLVPSGPMVSDLCSRGVGCLVGYMGLHLPEDFFRGAAGVMPTVAVTPALSEIWRLLSNDREKARSLHQELLPLLNFMMQSVEFLISCEKEILFRLGVLRSSYCREPTIHLDHAQKAELDIHIARLADRLGLIKSRPI
ncbi:MAG: dihydrodipicolinate synthase family protein [Acidobacteriaceae bacterium]